MTGISFTGRETLLTKGSPLLKNIERHQYVGDGQVIAKDAAKNIEKKSSKAEDVVKTHPYSSPYELIPNDTTPGNSTGKIVNFFG